MCVNLFFSKSFVLHVNVLYMYAYLNVHICTGNNINMPSGKPLQITVSASINRAEKGEGFQPN